MARIYSAILYVSVGIAVVSAADEKQDSIERNFRMIDAFNDPHYSSVTAAKNGFRVFTNTPDAGMTETLSITYRDGLYVAGEKVVTESEQRRVVSELQSRFVASEEEHRRVVSELRTDLDETKAEMLALLQAMREVSPANGSLILQPPTCEDPGGDKLHFNGTHWECVCKNGYSGDSCSSTCSTEWEVGWYGGAWVTSAVTVANAFECEMLCCANDSCMSWTFRHSDGHCHQKEESLDFYNVGNHTTAKRKNP